MKKRKAYVIGGGYSYINWMESVLVDKMEDADLVVGTGGEDWDIEWYYEGNNPHHTVHSNIWRDRSEMPEFKKAIELGKKIIGICRGAQGGCILAGGKLIQHQSNPSIVHPMITNEGRIIYISSLHHQSQYPIGLTEGEDYKVLGWTENMLDYRFLDSETQVANERELEIVYYPKIKFLAIQGHPEICFGHKEFYESTKWHRNILNKFMEDKL